MAATTEVSRLATSSSDKTYTYAAISTWDGTTIEDSDILMVYNNGTLLTLTTDYTVDDVNENIVLEAAYTIVTGDRIVIKRVTDITEPYVDFVNNSGIEASDLDLAIGQNRFKLQELQTSSDNALQYDLVNDCWDAQDRKICDLQSGTASGDAVNLGQVTALINGGTPMDVGSGLFARATGDNSTTSFVPQTDGGDYFPSTDVQAEKIFVSIDGILQSPNVDYEYVLNTSSRPTVNFLTGAPPSGSNNIQFRVIPGVVTTTYDAASLNGSVIIDATLDGDSLIDGSVDGDKLEDGTVDLDKLDAGTGAADRFLSSDAAGVVTAGVLTFDDLTRTGASGRTDMTSTEIVEAVNTDQSMSGSPGYSWTNSGSTMLFITTSWRTQNNAGTVRIYTTDAVERTLYEWQDPGGAIQDMHGSFFVPPGAVVRYYGGSGDVVKRITTQEV